MNLRLKIKINIKFIVNRKKIDFSYLNGGHNHIFSDMNGEKIN